MGDEIGRTSITQGEMKNAYTILVGRREEKENTWET
jgi:hypothetical protein